MSKRTVIRGNKVSEFDSNDPAALLEKRDRFKGIEFTMTTTAVSKDDIGISYETIKGVADDDEIFGFDFYQLLHKHIRDVFAERGYDEIRTSVGLPE